MIDHDVIPEEAILEFDIFPHIFYLGLDSVIMIQVSYSPHFLESTAKLYLISSEGIARIYGTETHYYEYVSEYDFSTKKFQNLVKNKNYLLHEWINSILTQ